MERPSIKGVAFQGVVTDVRELIGEGKLLRPDVERALPPEAAIYLDESPILSVLYPIEHLDAFTQILWASCGNREESYLIERGRHAAQRVFESPIYAQIMEKAQEWGGDHVPKALTGFSSSILNFGVWTLKGDVQDDHYEMELAEAAAYPETCRFTGMGFIEQVHSHFFQRKLRVTSSRPRQDLVIFVIERA